MNDFEIALNSLNQVTKHRVMNLWQSKRNRNTCRVILYFCYAYKAKALMITLELVTLKKNAQRSLETFQVSYHIISYHIISFHFISYLLKTFKGASHIRPITAFLNYHVPSLPLAFLSHRSLPLSSPRSFSLIPSYLSNLIL